MGTVSTTLEPLLNEHEAARALGLSVSNLRRRRLRRLQPSWVKLGARCLYRSRDLQEFISSNLIPVDRNDSAQNLGGEAA